MMAEEDCGRELDMTNAAILCDAYRLQTSQVPPTIMTHFQRLYEMKKQIRSLSLVIVKNSSGGGVNEIYLKPVNLP